MSEDGRNSVYLWIGSLALFGAFWASLHFNLFDGISDTWLWPIVMVLVAINVAQTIWGFWQRRASNPDNPNRN
ncbi:hypothetical protein FSZ31_10885 [Sphingorhabdus soli]|uniref:DUF5668 domain-containing protein n=1 Tax=Flavisphingopyxis soli TaxID=2601267 RepID=A0A5C6U5J9_9SPHN|nr:hypothetical protein FSZ31_10885 [Sphingorhabdus soli]